MYPQSTHKFTGFYNIVFFCFFYLCIKNEEEEVEGEEEEEGEEEKDEEG